MDEAVNPMRAVLAAILMLAMQALAHAQALQDPTRPPSQFGARAGGAAAVSSQPQLQSVLIARAAGGRRVAVIDGETVPLGGSFRGAQLVRMTQTEVELARGRERQVLKLYGPAAGAGTTVAAAAAAPAAVTRALP